MTIVDETVRAPDGDEPHPGRFALAGLLLMLPIGVLLLSVVLRIDAVETAFKAVMTVDGTRPNLLGWIYMWGGLLALLPAVGVSLWPVLRHGPREWRAHVYPANLAVAALGMLLISQTWGGLIADIWRCDVLHIPNCD